MDPILKYPGAKWRLANWIIQNMPTHESYVEPYFGSGAVFFNKPRARVETINDIDGAIVQFFRVCRDKPDELARAVGLTPWAREEFMGSVFMDDAPAEDDVERARQFAIRCWMTFGARASNKKGWRHTSSKNPNGGPANPQIWRKLPDLISKVGDRLLDAQVENRPALDVIRARDGERVLIYADPPYLRETRTANGDQYRHEMTDADHIAMLDVLRAHRGMVLLSGYDCPLYRDALEDWQLITHRTMAERGAIRIECLWINPAAQSRQMELPGIRA